MRDLHMLEGRKKHVDSIEDAHVLVTKNYPTATREGSVGAWSWHVGQELVAEAWVHQRNGWWVRVKS